MNRRQHLQAAADHLADVMEHLQLAGEGDLVLHERIQFGNVEERINDLINAEPRGKDTDDAYESMRELEA
jgi:hypothetical protein